uniref:WGR domain-containing protein n=1 Tax=Odontella aurita TaxID=265563 RepID=A0A7S4N0Z6_9STRA|mmetsp:Transcript_43201/g.131540  ORF Transcript_43201/g.131540 Transcript_43201/m.131540 type:complete len:476 (+) Transcript_43201:93-1520(+)
MTKKRNYLELSQDDGSSHKFYEVTQEGRDVTIRYGRIGTDGQSSTKTYPNAEKAEKDAEKKVKAKRKKGYEDAVQGVRKKRAVTRRSTESRASSAKQAPVLWRFGTGSTALGIFVDDGFCWAGNESGRVFCLDHEGEIFREYKLPEGVKCLVADDRWLYAGCDDGKVYDLSGKVPFVAYTIDESVNIYWMDIADGVLGVSDANGGVHIFNHEDEGQWNKSSDGVGGWMVRCDDKGVYHGHSGGVTMYDWKDGNQLWHKATGSVLFGWQEAITVFAGTSANKVHLITKEGKEKAVCKCDDSVYSCAAAEDGKYIFAGDSSSSVYCFDRKGKRLWKLGTGCGSALSMQYHEERIYMVTSDGSLACIDASEDAISAAKKGTVPTAKDLKAPAATTAAATTDTAIESTADGSEGVVVNCIQDGSRVCVRTESSKYNTEWNVQFPKNLREAGARFVVDELRESKSGGFYRAHGEIRRLTD